MNQEQTTEKLLEVISKFNGLAQEVKDLREYIQSEQFTGELDLRLTERLSLK